MFDFYFLITSFVILAGVLSLKKKEEYCIPGKTNINQTGKVFYIILFISIVLFQATRTKYNDTVTYSESFYLCQSSESIIVKLFTPYGGYFALELLVKRFTSNFNVLLLLCAILINIGFISFIFKYSKSLSQSLLLFFLGNFCFSMGGMKQAIAMSFLLFSIDLYLKDKKIFAIIPVIIGYFFHPYIIIMFVVPFMSKKAFSFKTLIVAIAILFAFFNLDTIFNLFAEIGTDYTGSNYGDYTINPLRVVYQSIPIAIMFYGKRQINQTKDKLLIMGVNMCTIAWFFVFLGLFINPIYPGRLATYYNILYPVIMPTVLGIVFKDSQYKGVVYVAFYLIAISYFLLDFTKLGSYPISYDRFNHISILSLFNW